MAKTGAGPEQSRGSGAKQEVSANLPKEALALAQQAREKIQTGLQEALRGIELGGTRGKARQRYTVSFVTKRGGFSDIIGELRQLESAAPGEQAKQAITTLIQELIQENQANIAQITSEAEEKPAKRPAEQVLRQPATGVAPVPAVEVLPATTAKFDATHSDGIITNAKQQIEPVELGVDDASRDINAQGHFVPDYGVLRNVLDAIQVRVVDFGAQANQLNQLQPALKAEVARLHTLSSKYADDPSSFSNIQAKVLQIQKIIDAIPQVSEKLKNIESLMWQKRVMLDVPQLADLDRLYHDTKNRGALLTAYRTDRPEIATLPNNSQKAIAASFTFYRDLSVAVATAEAYAQTLDQPKREFAEREFLAPARTQLATVEAQATRVWNHAHTLAFPELNEANAHSFISQLVVAEAVIDGGFVGHTATSLRQIRDDLALSLRSHINEMSAFFNITNLSMERLFVVSSAQWRPRATTVAASIESQIERLSGNERLLAVIQENIERLEARRAYDVVVYTNNQLTQDATRITEMFDEANQKGVDRIRLEQLKQEFLRIRFIVTKASIIRSWENYEFNDEGTSKSDAYNLNVIQPLLGSDLRVVVDQVAAVNRPRFEEELKRFTAEMTLRVSFYISARSVKNEVLGITDSATSKDIAMQIPISIPVYMNNMTNRVFGQLLTGAIGACPHPDLRSPYETELNPTIDRETFRIYDPVSLNFIDKEVNITAWAQGLRHLDMFLEGRAPNNLADGFKKRFAAQRRELHVLSGDEIFKIIYEFEICRLATKHGIDIRIPAEYERVKAMVRITKQDAIRAWNMSNMLIRPLELAPSSFNKPAPGYYALSPDYALGEVVGSDSGATGKLSPLIYFGIVGPTFERFRDPVRNPDGVVYTLDAYAGTHTTGSGGFIESLGRATHPKEIRQRIRKAFDKKGYGHRYDFLIDLPLLPLTPNGKTRDKGEEKERYSVFTTPLTNMVVRRQGGPNDGALVHYPRPDGTQDPARRIMVFADLVDQNSISPVENPNGSLVYEEMPFDRTLGQDEEYKSWVGQGKNAMAFYEDLLFVSPSDFAENAARKALADDNKVIKYATNILQPYAVMIREGLINREKLKNQILLVVLFLQGILMLASGKDMHEVERKFLTYNVGGHEGKEAVLVALGAGFSTSALARKFVSEFGNQVTQSLRLK